MQENNQINTNKPDQINSAKPNFFKLTKQKIKIMFLFFVIFLVWSLINIFMFSFSIEADCCPGKGMSLFEQLIMIINLGVFPIEYGFLAKIYNIIGETIWRYVIIIEWVIEIIYIYLLSVIFEYLKFKIKKNWLSYLILIVIIIVIGLINFLWQISGPNPSIII